MRAWTLVLLLPLARASTCTDYASSGTPLQLLTVGLSALDSCNSGVYYFQLDGYESGTTFSAWVDTTLTDGAGNSQGAVMVYMWKDIQIGGSASGTNSQSELPTLDQSGSGTPGFYNTNWVLPNTGTLVRTMCPSSATDQRFYIGASNKPTNSQTSLSQTGAVNWFAFTGKTGDSFASMWESYPSVNEFSGTDLICSHVCSSTQYYYQGGHPNQGDGTLQMVSAASAVNSGTWFDYTQDQSSASAGRGSSANSYQPHHAWTVWGTGTGTYSDAGMPAGMDSNHKSWLAVSCTPPPPPPSSPGADAMGDPHITFANGGSADFRGSHRDRYNFVASPGYSFAPYFQEVDFMYQSAVGLRQLVHGTFMTQASWRIRTAAGRELVIKADAMAPGEALVATLKSMPKAGVPLASALLGSEETLLMPWGEVSYDDVTISTRKLTVAVQTAAWTVEVTAKPIYGLVPPLLNNTHVHGRWEEDQMRFDISVKGVFPQPDAHGIVGQSFRDAVRRDGAVDVYDIEDAPEKANADGYLPPLTTSAQAEGAIDGVHTDYKLDHVLSTTFRYSRFDESAAQPLASAQDHRVATTSEWDGVAGSESLKRQQRALGAVA